MDIHFIRDNINEVKLNQEKRFKDPKIIDKILGILLILFSYFCVVYTNLIV